MRGSCWARWTREKVVAVLRSLGDGQLGRGKGGGEGAGEGKSRGKAYMNWRRRGMLGGKVCVEQRENGGGRFFFSSTSLEAVMDNVARVMMPSILTFFES